MKAHFFLMFSLAASAGGGNNDSIKSDEVSL